MGFEQTHTRAWLCAGSVPVEQAQMPSVIGQTSSSASLGAAPPSLADSEQGVPSMGEDGPCGQS